MAGATFHHLPIKTIEQDTTQSVVLGFAVPEELKEDFIFVPGQYLTLRTDVDGVDTRRSYSICSALDEPCLRVGIKKIEDGVFSNHVSQLKVGDELQVMTPQGTFQAPIGGHHEYLMLAAGSGITPILSIIESVLKYEERSRITLCYVNRTVDSMMFRSRINDLKDRFLTRFSLVFLMTGEVQDIELFNGRLDAEKLETMITTGLIDAIDSDSIFVCGPQSMAVQLIAKLEEMGVDSSRIKREIFTPSTPVKPASQKKAKTADKRKDVSEIRITIDGGQRSVFMSAEDNLLDAATRAGIELPYSCANGMCATCRCLIVSGEGEMRQNFSLEPWELEAGYLLGCQFVPKSKKVSLDFDAR